MEDLVEIEWQAVFNGGWKLPQAVSPNEQQLFQAAFVQRVTSDSFTHKFVESLSFGYSAGILEESFYCEVPSEMV